jgi:cell division septum initiation protein DivIVA
MSFFNSPEPGLEEPVASQTSRAQSPFAHVAGRFAQWLAGVDREQDEAELDAETRMGPLSELDPAVAEPDVPSSRFPLSPLGYSRAAVDEHLARLEQELERLRDDPPAPAMSISEELEMIGQQTASILVVAHDRAHETTRQAQERAERVIAEATASAAAVTEEAEQRLREIDSETDAVWRERERLLDDVRVISKALTELADQASDRFPAADPAAASKPQDTMPFSVVEAEGWQEDDE